MALTSPQQSRVWSQPQRAARGICAVFGAPKANKQLSLHTSVGQSPSWEPGSSAVTLNVQQRLQRHPRHMCHASSSSQEPVRKQMPIFPLGVVAMPHAVVPLMIFEARWGSYVLLLLLLQCRSAAEAPSVTSVACFDTAYP